MCGSISEDFHQRSSQSESLALVHGSEIFFSASEVASTGAGDGEKGFRFWQVDQVKLLLVLVPQLRNGAELLLLRSAASA